MTRIATKTAAQTQTPPLEEFLFERPCAQELLEGHKRILIECEGDDMDACRWFQRYDDIISRIVAKVTEREDQRVHAGGPASTNNRAAFEFIEDCVEAMKDIRLGFTRTGLLIDSLRENLWDCDPCAFLVADAARECGRRDVQLVVTSGHVFLKIGGLYWDISKCSVLDEEHMRKEYPAVHDIDGSTETFQAVSYLARAHARSADPALELADCLKALALNSLYSDAWSNCGMAYRAKGDLDKALFYCETAVKLDPTSAKIACNCGVVHLEKSETDCAIDLFQKAIALDPNYADAHYCCGLAYGRKKETDLAITFYLKTMEIAPDFVPAINNCANAYLEKGEFDLAIAFCLKALEVDPVCAAAACNCASALLQQGHFDEADSYFRLATKLNPNMAQAFYGWGNVHKERGDLELAISCYEKATHIDPTFAGAHQMCANIYSEREELDKMLPHMLKVFELRGAAAAGRDSG